MRFQNRGARAPEPGEVFLLIDGRIAILESLERAERQQKNETALGPANKGHEHQDPQEKFDFTVDHREQYERNRHRQLRPPAPRFVFILRLRERHEQRQENQRKEYGALRATETRENGER